MYFCLGETLIRVQQQDPTQLKEYVGMLMNLCEPITRKLEKKKNDMGLSDVYNAAQILREFAGMTNENGDAGVGVISGKFTASLEEQDCMRPDTTLSTTTSVIITRVDVFKTYVITNEKEYLMDVEFMNRFNQYIMNIEMMGDQRGSHHQQLAF